MASTRFAIFRSTALRSSACALAPQDISAAMRFHSAMKASQNAATISGCIRLLPRAASTWRSSAERRARVVLRHAPPFFAREQPRWSLPSSEKAPPQQPQTTLPVSRCLGRRRSQNGRAPCAWVYGKGPPPFTRRYLTSRLACRIQELAYGGLKPETRARLEALGEQLDGGNVVLRRIRADSRPLAGTRLIREWQGVQHVVTVRQGDFEFEGRPYQSLSAIARHITGTRWNG